jgi:hypothetical protein
MKRSDPLEMQVTAEPIAQLAMTRSERIERWATLLEEYDGRISPLPGIEYMPDAERRELAGPYYPMTVAFADPVFRALGLKGDRLSDAMDFFEMTVDDVHELMCECVSTGTMIAGRLHSYAKTGRYPGFWDHARSILGRG